jgi:hypothetical protein
MLNKINKSSQWNLSPYSCGCDLEANSTRKTRPIQGTYCIETSYEVKILLDCIQLSCLGLHPMSLLVFITPLLFRKFSWYDTKVFLWGTTGEFFLITSHKSRCISHKLASFVFYPINSVSCGVDLVFLFYIVAMKSNSRCVHDLCLPETTLEPPGAQSKSLSGCLLPYMIPGLFSLQHVAWVVIHIFTSSYFS